MAAHLDDGIMVDQARSFVREEIAKTVKALKSLHDDEVALAALDRIAELSVEAIRRGNKVMFAGNGGSAADAQHLAAELVGKLAYDRPGLPAISLTTDTSILTAVGNDYGYDEVFRRQIEALGVAGDVLVAISTSGRSRSVLRALEVARAKRIATVGMTGQSGGDMLGLCDVCLRIPSTDTQKIQEAHIVLGHIFCCIIERAMFPR
jgi:D-sedoheptulose 7-phosphate isomerase